MNAEAATQTAPTPLDWAIPGDLAAPVACRAASPRAVDRSALFQEIYASYLPIVFKTARAFARSKEDQEDLAQEILLALWEASECFEARSKLSTYVYRIAYRRALNWKRGRRRYENKLVLFEQEQKGDVPGASDDEFNAKLEWLYGAIARLKEIDRTICLMFLDGLPYAEIADVLGVTETVVGVRVHRCKQQLIAQLDQAVLNPALGFARRESHRAS